MREENDMLTTLFVLGGTATVLTAVAAALSGLN